MKGRWVARRGSPAVVVQRQVGDDLAPFQVEAAEIGQPSKPPTLGHRAALAGVVKLTIADRNIRWPLLGTPRASLSISMLAAGPTWWWHAADLRVCRRRTTRPGDLAPRFHASKALRCNGRSAPVPARSDRARLRAKTVHDMGSLVGWTSRVERAASRHGYAGRSAAWWVGKYSTDSRDTGPSSSSSSCGADVVAGRAAQHLQGRRLPT